MDIGRPSLYYVGKCKWRYIYSLSLFLKGPHTPTMGRDFMCLNL